MQPFLINVYDPTDIQLLYGMIAKTVRAGAGIELHIIIGRGNKRGKPNAHWEPVPYINVGHKLVPEKEVRDQGIAG